MSEIIDIKTLDLSKLELSSVPKPEPVIVVVEVPAPEVIPTIHESVPMPFPEVTETATVQDEPITATVPDVFITGQTGPTGPINGDYITDPTPPVDAPKPKVADKVYNGTKYLFGFVCAAFIIVFLTQFAFNLPHPKHWHLGILGSNRGTVETVFIPEPPKAKQTKIIESGKFLTAYEFADGKIVKLTGGSHSWRIHNPGRLSFNAHTQSFGAFAADKGYAVFPTYAQGRKALEVMLFDDPKHGYKQLSIKAAIKKFNEGDSDSPAYSKLVAKALKLQEQVRLEVLTPDQRRTFMDQIELIEQFVPGRTWEYKNIEDYKRLG